ncbi:MAG TPA: DUF4384 domain-containing protein [Blastocatellia bacterium]|nr:DUF4384 domain-containing protein [Blastocatellia bacterium]
MRLVTKLTIVGLALTAMTASSVSADKRPQKIDEGKRARGLFVNKRSDAMSVLVLKNDNGSLVPVDPSNEFKAGDQIKIQLESNFDGFIYVVNIQPSGKRCLMFPYPEAANNAVQSGERYEIPPGNDTMEFDQEKGTEVLQVIMSRDRIPYLDAALKEPERCLAQTASSAAAELQAGIVKKVTPVVPPGGSKMRSRDIILAAGKDKDANGSVVAVPDNGGGGKLKSGEIAPFEIRLKHN